MPAGLAMPDTTNPAGGVSTSDTVSVAAVPLVLLGVRVDVPPRPIVAGLKALPSVGAAAPAGMTTGGRAWIARASTRTFCSIDTHDFCHFRGKESPEKSSMGRLSGASTTFQNLPPAININGALMSNKPEAVLTPARERFEWLLLACLLVLCDFINIPCPRDKNSCNDYAYFSHKAKHSAIK